MMLLRLDTPAVQRLLKDNPEMELELTQACTAEIVKRLTTQNLNAILKQVEPTLMAALSAHADETAWISTELQKYLDRMFERQGWSSSYKPTADTKAKLAAAVKEVSEELVRDASSALVPLIRRSVEEKAAEIEAAVERRVANIQEQLIADEVDRRVKARMTAILDATRGAS